MAVKTVFFDYGGTLVAVSKPWAEVKPKAVMSGFRAMQRAGLKLSFDEYRDMSDSVFQRNKELETAEKRDIPDLVTYREIVDTLFPSKAAAWRRKVAAQATEAFWSVARKNFLPRDGATQMLLKLRALGLRTAVVSNHHHPPALRGHLKELGISSYFSKIYASSSVGMRKPDLRFFRICLREMKTRPDQAVFVGDSPQYDIEGADRAGIRTILVTGGWLTESQSQIGTSDVAPDFVVSDLQEIPKIVSSLMRSK